MQERRKQVSEGVAVSPWWPAAVQGSRYPGFLQATWHHHGHQSQSSRRSQLLAALWGLLETSQSLPEVTLQMEAS